MWELADLTLTRPALAARLRQHWDTSLADYSAQLWAAPPDAPVEDAFAAALREEAMRITGSVEVAEHLLRHRVAVTAHHVTPTNGPGFLAIDRIAIAGKPSGVPLVVLAWSGVALSNAAWSGAISFNGLIERLLVPGSPTERRLRKAQADRARDSGVTELRLSLFPSKQRDALLYRLGVPERLGEVLRDVRPEARHLFADLDDAEDYPTWALKTCATIQQAILGDAVVYLDLNRIVADYLTRIAGQSDHPLVRFLRAESHDEAFAAKSWAYRRRSSGKLAVMGPEAAAALLAGTICPGLVPAFVALRCVNGIRCLGSFNQDDYLRAFAAAWGAWDDPQPTLVTGRSPGETYPLDLALSGTVLSAEGLVMRDLWAPLLPRLLR
ncbi:MAG: hypothetical protein AAFV53_36765 [Myxococcota bacterium]